MNSHEYLYLSLNYDLFNLKSHKHKEKKCNLILLLISNILQHYVHNV